jgi:hypothetical protein
MTQNSEVFWSRFFDGWEKAPMAVRDAGQDELLISQGELFDAVVAACAAGDGTFWLRGKRVPMDFVSPYVPIATDRNFEGYDHRIRRAISDGEYMLRVASPHKQNFAFWQRTRSWLRPLLSRVGVPNNMINTGVFLGRYRRTPFGAHIDYQSAITFPVIGTKVFLAWPDDFVRAHPKLMGAMDFDSFREQGVELIADPGGVMYWPHTEWHVGIGTGEFGVTLNISFWYADDEEIALKLGSSLIRSRIERPEPLKREPQLHLPLPPRKGMLGKLPVALTRAGRQLSADIFGSDHVLAKLHELWLGRVSADGFLHVPPLRESRELLPEMRVRGDASWPVYWHQIEGGLIAGINGHICKLSGPAPTPLIDVLKSINSSAPLQVSALCEHVATATGNDRSVPTILSQFYRARAFEIIDDPGF